LASASSRFAAEHAFIRDTVKETRRASES